MNKRTNSPFETKRLPIVPDAVAPDGTDVRVLLKLSGGSVAHFELQPGKTTIAVAHRSVEEIWYIVSGLGEMWRRQGGQEETVLLEKDVCVTIPLGTSFQVRSLGSVPLRAVAVTMPPWPGDDEAITVAGEWLIDP